MATDSLMPSGMGVHMPALVDAMDGLGDEAPDLQRAFVAERPGFVQPVFDHA